jgi:hypothetical protein
MIGAITLRIFQRAPADGAKRGNPVVANATDQVITPAWSSAKAKDHAEVKLVFQPFVRAPRGGGGIDGDSQPWCSLSYLCSVRVPGPGRKRLDQIA